MIILIIAFSFLVSPASVIDHSSNDLISGINGCWVTYKDNGEPREYLLIDTERSLFFYFKHENYKHYARLDSPVILSNSGTPFLTVYIQTCKGGYSKFFFMYDRKFQLRSSCIFRKDHLIDDKKWTKINAPNWFVNLEFNLDCERYSD